MNLKGCIAISDEQYERLNKILKAPDNIDDVERIIISRKHYDELEEGKPIWNIEYIGMSGVFKIDDDGDLFIVEQTERKLTD